MSLTAVLDPAVHLVYLAVTGLASALPIPAGLGVRTALAVVLVTWAVRAALLPLAISAARARLAAAGVADEVARLRHRYADDPPRLVQETRRVYREAGVTPFAGLLPLLAQLPVISTLYRLLVVPVVAGQPNLVLHAVVLGVPFSGHWPALIVSAGLFSGTTLVLVALLFLLAAVVKLAGSLGGAGAVGTGAVGTGGGSGRLLRVLPYTVVAFAVVAPVAVGLYLLASTTWSVVERAILPS